MKDYYLILGVRRDEPVEGIRAAYRRLAKTHHPDRAGPEGAAEFRHITDAYHALSNPEERRQYDRRLRERETPVRRSSPVRARAPSQGPAASHWDLILSPAEAAFGCSFLLRVEEPGTRAPRAFRVRVPPGTPPGSLLEIAVSETSRLVIHVDVSG
jgi:curved DNA-binding protein CbpA